MLKHHEFTLFILEDSDELRRSYIELLNPLFNIEAFSDIKSLEERWEEIWSESSIHVLMADTNLKDGHFVNFLKNKIKECVLPNVVLVSGEHEDTDAVKEYLRLGIRDFINKPASEEVLKAKLIYIFESLLEAKEKNRILKLFPDKLMIMRNELEVSLTPKEYRIIDVLMKAKDYKAKKETLIVNVWGKTTVSPKNLEVQISRLRKKLEILIMDIVFTEDGEYQLSDKKIE